MEIDLMKDAYKEMIPKYWRKEITNVCQLTNGDLIGFHKPHLETSFCFDDSYDYDGTVRFANTIARTEEYFRAKNLEGFDNKVNSIINAYAIYSAKAYWKLPEDTKARRLDICRYENDVDDDTLYKLTDEDIEIILSMYAEERKKFEKRINTYLKRYGTSKIRTWTYWGDR